MSHDEGQRDGTGAQRLHTAMRLFSLALAIGVVALIAHDPERIGSHGTPLERAFGAALMVGALGSAFHGFGLRGKRRHVRTLTHPGIAWSLVAAGLAGAFLI